MSTPIANSFRRSVESSYYASYPVGRPVVTGVHDFLDLEDSVVHDEEYQIQRGAGTLAPEDVPEDIPTAPEDIPTAPTVPVRVYFDW